MAARRDVKTIGPNLVPNAGFEKGKRGDLPEGWELHCKYDFLEPGFALSRKGGEAALLATDGGNEDSAGWLEANFEFERGKTYLMTADIEFTRNVNPQFNLLFAFYADNFNNGVFDFRRISDTEAHGYGRFEVPGEGKAEGAFRIYFRGKVDGKAWVKKVSFAECEPIEPRWVRIATTQGSVSMESWGKVLDAIGKRGVDLALLPETFNQAHEPEAANGPSPRLMIAKAREYDMFVSGSYLRKNPDDGLVYNTCSLYDRKGKRVGLYDKNHPYSPEWFNDGVSPGRGVEVFDTELGRIGMLICYDSWFVDVAQLLALKGAEIILFPNAGYCRGLMPARANDNGVRFVVSSLGSPIGIWDTSGGDVENPDSDPTRSAGPEETFRNVLTETVEGVKILYAEMDLTRSPSAHNWGGPMQSAPGGRRNRREQRSLLYDEIARETNRWWTED